MKPYSLQPKPWCTCVIGIVVAGLLSPLAFASSINIEPGHGMMRDDSNLVGEDWRERALSNEAAVPYRRIVDGQGVVSIVPNSHDWSDDESIEHHCRHVGENHSSSRNPPLRRGRTESVCEPAFITHDVGPEGLGLDGLDFLSLTDLYDITLIELPEEPAIPALPGWLGSSNLILPGSVANDGTVAATRKIVNAYFMWHRLVRLRPGSMNWESLESSLNVLKNPIISPDGDSILFTGSDFRRPAIFRDGLINYLPGFLNTSEAFGASDDFSRFVGREYLYDPEEDTNWPTVWTWDTDGGKVELSTLFSLPRPYTPLTYRLRSQWLPQNTSFALPYPKAISNDGQRAIGIEDLVSRFIPGWDDGAWDLNGNFGVFWQSGEEMRIIRGQNGEYLGDPLACDANCDIVFGNGYWRSYNYHLRGQSDHAWYWRPATGESGSLGALNPTEENPEGWLYYLFDVSGDGELAVGYYKSPDMAGGLPSGDSAYDGLIWSEATGFVLLSDLLAETGQGLDWPSVYAHDISSNGEYILLTTGEIFTAPGQIGVPSLARMALLRLTPKAP